MPPQPRTMPCKVAPSASLARTVSGERAPTGAGIACRQWQTGAMSEAEAEAEVARTCRMTWRNHEPTDRSAATTKGRYQTSLLSKPSSTPTLHDSLLCFLATTPSFSHRRGYNRQHYQHFHLYTTAELAHIAEHTASPTATIFRRRHPSDSAIVIVTVIPGHLETCGSSQHLSSATRATTPLVSP